MKKRPKETPSIYIDANKNCVNKIYLNKNKNLINF